jgi:pyrroline-5-carboxylate reductase
MPNTAIAYCESMTCLAADKSDEKALSISRHIFEGLGACVVVTEDQIVPATALCAW